MGIVNSEDSEGAKEMTARKRRLDDQVYLRDGRCRLIVG